MIRTPLRWLKQFLTAVLILVVLVASCELGLRVYDSRTGQVTRREVYDQGLVCKSWFVHHELKPLQRLAQPAPDGGRTIKLLTNSHGLRGAELEIPKPPGVFRILCMGDEQTLASGVDESETFCAQLQQLLQSRTRIPIEVVNAGIPDSCPLLASLQLQHKFLGLQPDLVLLHWDMSDVADDYRYRRLVTMSNTHTPLACAHPGLEMPRQRPPRTPLDLFLLPEWAKQNFGSLWAKKMLPATAQDIDSPTGKYLWLEDQPPDWSVHIRQALSPSVRMRDLLQGVYSDFVVAAYPAPWQVSATASNAPEVRGPAGLREGALYANRAPFETLRRYFDEARIRFCDASPEFQAASEKDRLYFQQSPQFTREGHTLYARALAVFLVQNLRGPWNQSSFAPPGGPPAAAAPRQRQ